MSVFKPNSRHLREVLIFCFHLKKTTAEAYRMLSNTYGKAVISEWVVSTLQEWWFWCRGPSRRWKRENFRRSRIGGLTCWRLVPTARRIGRIIESDSTSHFETPRSYGNDSETRKLDSVLVKAERCWTAFVCLWTAASKIESEGVFTSHCDRRRKIGPLR